MYNRYVPQPDGSYRRNRLPDAEQPASPERGQQGRISHQEPPCPQESPPPPNSRPRNSSRPAGRAAPSPRQPPSYTPPPKSGGITGFLRQLLPKDFETEDLLIVLLLLLMSEDSKENQNTALLTLALYLFM